MHPPNFKVPELADAASASAAAAAELCETIGEGAITPDSHLGTGATAGYLAEALLVALKSTHYPTPNTSLELRTLLAACSVEVSRIIERHVFGADTPEGGAS